MSADARGSTGTTMVLSVATVAVCTLPLFLVGALAPQLTRELGFTAAGLGIAIAAYRVGAAATVGALGRLTDRVGSTTAIRLAALLTGVAALGIVTSARTLAGLVVWLLVGAMGRSLCQPAVNRLIVQRVPVARQGAAFGVKQSGGPSASMLAGLSVPILAATLGWRAAFVATAVFAGLIILAVGRATAGPSDVPRMRRPRVPLRGRRTLAMLFVAFTLASGASSILTAFYVASATDAGLSAAHAGSLLAVASVGAITVRLLSGVACDRLAGGHLILCAGMLGLGALGTLALASGQPWLLAAGILIGLAGSWGFDGVFWYAIVRRYQAQPGQVTGALEPGGLLGGAGTPLLFGFVVELTSYRVAWIGGAVLAMAGAAAMLQGDRLLRRGDPD